MRHEPFSFFPSATLSRYVITPPSAVFLRSDKQDNKVVELFFFLTFYAKRARSLSSRLAALGGRFLLREDGLSGTGRRDVDFQARPLPFLFCHA